MEPERGPKGTPVVLAGFAKVVYTGIEVQILISTRHWMRVNQKTWQEDDLKEMSYIIKKIERKQASQSDNDAALELDTDFY